MFEDDFDVTIKFHTGYDVLFTIEEVSGDGLIMSALDTRTKEEIITPMSHDDVSKLIKVLTNAELYIRENK